MGSGVISFEGERRDGELSLVFDDAVPALVAGSAQPGGGPQFGFDAEEVAWRPVLVLGAPCAADDSRRRLAALVADDLEGVDVDAGLLEVLGGDPVAGVEDVGLAVVAAPPDVGGAAGGDGADEGEVVMRVRAQRLPAGGAGDFVELRGGPVSHRRCIGIP